MWSKELPVAFVAARARGCVRAIRHDYIVVDLLATNLPSRTTTTIESDPMMLETVQLYVPAAPTRGTIRTLE